MKFPDINRQNPGIKKTKKKNKIFVVEILAFFTNLSFQSTSFANKIVFTKIFEFEARNIFKHNEMLWEMSTLVSAVHLRTYFCFMFSLKGCNDIFYAGKTLYNSQRNPRCVISQFQISWQFLQLNYTLLYATVRKSARSHRWITETKTKPAPITLMNLIVDEKYHGWIW